MRGLVLGALALVGCGPGFDFRALSAARHGDDTVEAQPFIECTPGWNGCPKQLCLQVTFFAGGVTDEVDRCEIIDNVKSGHFFRDPVHSSKALPRDPVASVTVALPEGEGRRSAAIPAQPQP